MRISSRSSTNNSNSVSEGLFCSSFNLLSPATSAYLAVSISKLEAEPLDESSLSSELPLNSLESDEDGTNADILCFSVSSLFLEAY